MFTEFRKIIAVSVLSCFTTILFADKWENSISGEGRNVDDSKYGTALISNGNLSTVIDYLGVQKRRNYSQIVPYIVRQARRYPTLFSDIL